MRKKYLALKGAVGPSNHEIVPRAAKVNAQRRRAAARGLESRLPIFLSGQLPLLYLGVMPFRGLGGVSSSSDTTWSRSFTHASFFRASVNSS